MFRRSLHNYVPFLTADPTPNVLNCHNDANCVADLLNNAVARISFVEDNSALFCSATMMSNQQADFAPYVLTANHCVRDQGVAAFGRGSMVFHEHSVQQQCRRRRHTQPRRRVGAQH